MSTNSRAHTNTFLSWCFCW